MRKSLATIAVSALAFGALGVGASAVEPDQALASPGVKTVFDWDIYSAYNSETKTVADITGDGVADELRFVLKPWNYDGSKSLIVYVNGKKAYATTDGCGGYVCEVQRVELASGKAFLYIQYTGDNGDGVYGVFEHKGDKLHKLLSCSVAKGIRHPGIEKVKVNGNTLSVTYSNQPLALGICEFTYSYKYKSGKLKATSSVASGFAYKFEYCSGGKKKGMRSTLTLCSTTPAYKKASTKSKKVTLGKGAKVKLEAVKNMDRCLWFKTKVKKTGKTYWIKNPSKYLKYGKYPAGTYFKEKFQVG